MIRTADVEAGNDHYSHAHFHQQALMNAATKRAVTGNGVRREPVDFLEGAAEAAAPQAMKWLGKILDQSAARSAAQHAVTQVSTTQFDARGGKRGGVEWGIKFYLIPPFVPHPTC